jgi:hypothetical protein
MKKQLIVVCTVAIVAFGLGSYASGQEDQPFSEGMLTLLAAAPGDSWDSAGLMNIEVRLLKYSVYLSGAAAEVGVTYFDHLIDYEDGVVRFFFYTGRAWNRADVINLFALIGTPMPNLDTDVLELVVADFTGEQLHTYSFETENWTSGPLVQD